MNYSKIILTFATICATLCSYGQQNQTTKLEQQVQAAIAKGYPATVFISDYDEKTKTITGARCSGVVVDPEGHILAVAHAFAVNKVYLVVFPDGKQYTATGLGRIARNDMGMLKINEKGVWPYAEMAAPSKLKLNEPVLSIAYPGSITPKQEVVRFGKVTALNVRRGVMFQSSCLMEPGDSGGPIFDLEGKVVGVSSNIKITMEENFDVHIDQYRKYWKALQKPVDYKELPESDSLAMSTTTTYAEIQDISEEKLKGLEKKLAQHTYKIVSQFNDGSKKIVGTLISPKGLATPTLPKEKSYLISKNSMVGNKPMVELKNGKTILATIVARDFSRDLVLLSVDLKLKDAVELASVSSDTLKFADLGRFLLSPQPDTGRRRSVIGSLRFNMPGTYSWGFFGGGTIYQDGKLTLGMVLPNGPASLAKLEVGDEIKSLNGQVYTDPMLFVRAIQKNRPGDSIVLVRGRQGLEDTLHIRLALRPRVESTHIAEKFSDGKSERRDGFAGVFAHDARIRPAECGGPVFDLNGKFIGVNIARLSRTCAITVTATAIRDFVTEAFNTSFKGTGS